jgi:hypothetical protein
MRGGGRSKSRLVFELGGKRRVGECKAHGEKCERVREEGHIVMFKCFDVTCDSLPPPFLQASSPKSKWHQNYTSSLQLMQVQLCHSRLPNLVSYEALHVKNTA